MAFGRALMNWVGIKAPVPAMRPTDIVGTGGWWPLIREPFTGAWQRNLEIGADSVLSNPYLFRCVSLISTDVAKMRLKLIRESSPGVWEEDNNPAWSPVIRKPNGYQNRIQFFEAWINSKLNAGNTYALKERDERGVVTRLHLLDPRRVRVLVAADGDIFYELYSDNLASVPEQTVVPAEEIIHDRWNCLFHPLVGLSPIFANALISNQGLRIIQHSTTFFTNGANPGGLIIAETNENKITEDVKQRWIDDWKTKFSGPNAGKIGVLVGKLRFEKLGVSALDSQLIEQLKWTAEAICASYGVPAYRVGAAAAPTLNNIEALQRQYYQDCLQIHVEAIELCIDEGLRLPANWGVEFDLDVLVRMDTATQIRALAEGVGAGILKPDEARLRLGYSRVEGGDTPYLQQQNYSLAALNKRDQSDNPFGTGGGAGGPATPPAEPPAAAEVVPEPDTTTQNSIEALDLIAALRTKFAGQLDHA